MTKAVIEKISWKKIRDSVVKINSTLCKSIDSLDPDDELSLYKISYPYGSNIVENGVFHVPLPNGNIVPLHDSLVNRQLKIDLGYAQGGLPVGVVLKNSYELFINTKNCILPILIVQPGSIIALWKELETVSHFHPIRIFSITAGARCIFMLPNISDLALHKNLKLDFNVRQLPPKNLLDQWEIFKTIVHHPVSQCAWSTDLLFFSGKWFEKIKNDKAWQSLYLLLLQNVWNSCAYERNRMFYDFIVSCAQANRNLKPNPYLTDTLRHLLMIGLGTGVGFGVATNDILGPVELLQRVYIESYGLRKYAPTLMHPMHFSLYHSHNPVYYSLLLPTTLAFSPKSRKISSTLHDLSELKHILTVFFDEIRCDRLKIEDTIIGQLASQIKFDFYHSKYDRHGEIKSTRELTEGDPALLRNLEQHKKREFAESGTFVRGCIRISHQKDNPCVM
ncbi:MAG: hypothetical protein ACD_29C00485G0003 [uncultured bacterium]|nr:MAG: hypothetical protein ACD_29C00485G0003 [uncultured bacterium]